MRASLPGAAVSKVGLDSATWVYNAPPDAAIAAASLWRTAQAASVGYPASGVAFLTTPPDAIAVPGTFYQCVACSLVGNPAQPLDPGNVVTVPVTNLDGTTQLFATAECNIGDPGAVCPTTSGSPPPPSAEIDIYAADLTLNSQAVPVVANPGSSLVTAASLTGTEILTFSAADAGPGLYQVTFTVDGKLLSTVPVDSNGGKCVPVTPAPADGTNAFLYGQPCDASANLTETFDTTQVANGMHELLVQVTDASGVAATVLDRKVMFQNGGAASTGPAAAPPVPNGVNASPAAVLHVRWKRSPTATLTSEWGQVRRVTGTLTTSAGQPIAGAVVGVEALPSYGGASWTTLGSVKTDTHGAFALSVAGDASSRRYSFSYDAHLGDSAPAASASLTLLVHAGIALSVSPRVTSVGRTITFRGVVRGSPIPLGGKQLVLEARAPGSAWLQFQVIRTDARGRFRAGYRFRFAGPATYQFRAVSEYEADFPFLGGASDVVGVFER